jgi:hypothetical protein
VIFKAKLRRLVFSLACRPVMSRRELIDKRGNKENLKLILGNLY